MGEEIGTLARDWTIGGKRLPPHIHTKHSWQGTDYGSDALYRCRRQMGRRRAEIGPGEWHKMSEGEVDESGREQGKRGNVGLLQQLCGVRTSKQEAAPVTAREGSGPAQTRCRTIGHVLCFSRRHGLWRERAKIETAAGAWGYR